MSDIVKGLRLLVPSDSSGAAIKAIDEITRLRNELYIAQEWSARVIAGREQDIAETTALRAEVERFKVSLSDAVRQTQEQADDIIALRAEVERLRSALRGSYEVYAGSDGFIPATAAEGYQQQIIKQMVDCISAALEGKP